MRRPRRSVQRAMNDQEMVEYVARQFIERHGRKGDRRPFVSTLIAPMTTLELHDHDKAALAAALRATIAADRYPLSPRVQQR